jgi:hypothetical protein
VAVVVGLLLGFGPVYAALDLTPYATVAAALLGGGMVHAVAQFRKTPAEVESISVATLSAALGKMQEEIARKDKIIERLDGENAACRDRIQRLEDRLDARVQPGRGEA